MATNKFEWEQINNTKAQVNIEVDTAHGWVNIIDKEDPESTVFLGDNIGYEFIDKARAMYKKNEDLSIEDAYHFFAYDYLILLSE